MVACDDECGGGGDECDGDVKWNGEWMSEQVMSALMIHYSCTINVDLFLFLTWHSLNISCTEEFIINLQMKIYIPDWKWNMGEQ